MAKLIVYDYSKEPPEIANIDSPEIQNYLNSVPNHTRVELTIQEPNFQPITVGHYFKLGNN